MNQASHSHGTFCAWRCRGGRERIAGRHIRSRRRRFRQLQGRHPGLHLPQVQARTGDQENRRWDWLSASPRSRAAGKHAEQIKAVLSLCKDNGITPAAYGVEPFSKDNDANKKRFEFAAALGIKSLGADPTPDSFDLLDKLCELYKIAIAIHPHGPSGKGRHRWWSAEIILEAVKDHHPLIGTCLDTGHLIRMAQLGEKLDPAQQIKVMGDHNFGMHLKDHNNDKKEDVIFGKDGGVLDIGAVAQGAQGREVHRRTQHRIREQAG